MFEARVLSSFSDLPRRDWEALFAGRVEGLDYFKACERAAPKDAAIAGLAVFRDDRPVAACPLFIVHYASEMPWSGGGRWIPQGVRTYRLPLQLHGLGSPLTDTCPIVVADDLTAPERVQAVTQLLSCANGWSGTGLLDALLIKDVDEETDVWLGPIAHALGYSRLETLPVAVFPITFADEAAYLKSLPHSVSKYLRHRLKKAAGVTVEQVSDVAAIAPELVALYRAQQASAKTNSDVFDAIGDDYFAAIHEAMPEATTVLTYRVAGQLAGFMYAIADGTTLATKYVGFKQPQGREHSLYFLNWMTVIRLCLARGIRQIHVGQNSYAVKAMLGCTFERRSLYCRHARRAPNFVMQQACKYMSFANIDDELVALGSAAPYAKRDVAPRAAAQQNHML